MPRTERPVLGERCVARSRAGGSPIPSCPSTCLSAASGHLLQPYQALATDHPPAQRKTEAHSQKQWAVVPSASLGRSLSCTERACLLWNL
jgi:hypothetical protein